MLTIDYKNNTVTNSKGIKVAQFRYDVTLDRFILDNVINYRAYCNWDNTKSLYLCEVKRKWKSIKAMEYYVLSLYIEFGGN